MASNNISLLSSETRVEVPYVKVTIGQYTFGTYGQTTATKTAEGFSNAVSIMYPNYVKSLSIQKINGQVNQYTLTLVYPVTPTDDPNFFEKVFSSVSDSRKIVFSYGDMKLPKYIYKDEQALITNIRSNFEIKSHTITYVVSAVPSAALSAYSVDTFNNQGRKKPSSEIYRIIFHEPKYGLQDIFYGMKSEEQARQNKLIPEDDAEVVLETKQNISVLDYLKYLVSCMRPDSDIASQKESGEVYALKIIDDATNTTDKDGIEYGGPYIKIELVSKAKLNSEAYEIDIGFPTSNIVTQFNVENDESYSIYYDWQSKLNENTYVRRLNNDGLWEDVYAPSISSKNDKCETRPQDLNWWTKVTEYPITATITIKGLLRPAILMTYVRLNVYFYGQKHINSGLYIVTKQLDTIDSRGYRTQLSLTRIAGDTQ